MLRNLLYIFCLTQILACSSLNAIFSGKKGYNVDTKAYAKYEQADYVNHLSHLGSLYKKSPNVKLVQISKENLQYLHSIYYKILNSNETLLNVSLAPEFYIVNDKTPFYFSLPNAQFFFSLGLIKKYFNYEEILVSALVHEMIKSHRNLYKKDIIVPVGYLRIEKILNIVRIELEEKIEIDKWSFYAMKRSGFDSFAYLNWLQVQNKNTLDFALQVGDTHRISREEFMFKNFIVEEGLSTKDARSFEMNSSKSFYKFIREIKRIKI